LVFDLLRDRFTVVDRLAVSEWLHRRVPDHAGLVDYGGSESRLDCYDVCRHGSHLGGGLYALDAAARRVRHADQRSQRSLAGFECARNWFGAAVARTDVVHGSLSGAVS